MNFYFAPMEGLTGYVYRNAHHAFFNTVSKYFSPFIMANQSERFKSRDINDIMPDNNRGLALIPQLLTNNSKDFIHTSKKIQQLGYQEINFNLGCPSGTVVSKYRGSGFLSKRQELDVFFNEIFAQSVTKISIKTRIGKERPEEFYELIEIYNKYPFEELIIHPRIQSDLYRNKPNLKIFEDALRLSKIPVCYNGDIFTANDFRAFHTSFPQVETIMLGRGMITNPGLVASILYNTKLNKSILKDFHNRIFEEYQRILFGERNVLFKMKELWFYMIEVFSNNTPYFKRINKSERLSEYTSAVSSLFNEQDIITKER